MNGFKFQYLKAVGDAPMPSAAKHVLRVIADYADADGSNARMGVARIARNTGYGERHVQRQIRWLRDHGWLILGHRGHRSGDGVGHPNVFRLAYGTTEVPSVTEETLDRTDATDSPADAAESQPDTSNGCERGGCTNRALIGESLCMTHYLEEAKKNEVPF